MFEFLSNLILVIGMGFFLRAWDLRAKKNTALRWFLAGLVLVGIWVAVKAALYYGYL